MLAVWALNGLLVAVAVLIHYEFLHRLSVLMPRMSIKHRVRILLGVFGALIAHAVEIWVFAFGYHYMHWTEGWGRLEGNSSGSMVDCVYFSFTTFTTLGFGDIQPVGDIRYLTGIEALTGLVLITWTASFLYYEMRLFWDNN